MSNWSHQLSQQMNYQGLGWIALFVAILASWAYMFVMVMPDEASAHHHMHAGSAATLHLFVMWALMALAMMAPSLVPMLRTYNDLIDTGAATKSGFYTLVLGYLVAWVVFAVFATFLQMWVARQGLINGAGKSVSLWFNVGLLTLAGAYQFTTLKDACLTQCRMPMSFFMAHWREGAWGALLMGLRLGVICVICCWALMLLGFIGGIMSLVWMGAATVLMTVEKLPDVGYFITRPIGILFLCAAALTAMWTVYSTF